jgi:hypothetical protein
MKICAKIIGVLSVLVLILFVCYKIAQDYGVVRATSAEESSMLHKLQKATPKEVIEICFWATNHHSKRVLKAVGADVDGDEIRRLELISIKGLKSKTPNEKVFAVRFQAFIRFDMESGFKNGDIVEWTFTLNRSKIDGHWQISNYGWC